MSYCLDTYAALVDTATSHRLHPVTLTGLSGYSFARLADFLTLTVVLENMWQQIAEILNSYYSRTFLNHTYCPAWLQPPPPFRFQITKT
jgi:hypothetical protein